MPFEHAIPTMSDVESFFPAHALVAALALLSEGSPLANNLLGKYRLDLGTFIGHNRGMGNQAGVMPGSSPRQL